MLGGRAANVIFALVLTLAITRILGPAQFGVFSFLNSVVITGGIIAGFGLDTWMVREIAHRPEEAHATLSTVLGLKVWLSILTISATALTCYGLDLPAATFGALVLFLPVIAFNTLSQSLWHYADTHGRFRDHSLLWATTNGLRMVFGVSLLFIESDLLLLLYGLIMAEMTGFFISQILIKRRIGFSQISFLPLDGLTVLKKSAPFAGVVIFGVLYFRLDIMMMTWLTMPKEIGWYAASYKFVELYTLLPSSIFVVLFPELARQFKDGATPFRAAIKKVIPSLFVLGLAAFIFVYLLADPLVSVLFGDDYRPAIPMLKILSPSLLLITLNYFLSYTLFSSGHEKANLIFLGLLTGLNATLNWLWIPAFGGQGAAYATVASEFVYLLMGAAWMMRLVKKEDSQESLG